MRCTVFSYSAVLSTTFEDAAFAADVDPNSKQYAFARCQKPEELLVILNNIRKNNKVACLDIFAHGDSGELKLGDTLLLSPKSTNWGVIDALNRILAEKGQVRLLGCFTATCKEGLEVLKELSKHLKNREVFGTKSLIYQWDFGGTGFKESSNGYLVSSRELSQRNVHVEPEPRPANDEKATPNEAYFIKRVQKEYRPLGRMSTPAAIIDTGESFEEKQTHLTIACKGKLLLIQEACQKQPMVYMREKRCGESNVKDLKEIFGIH